MVLKYLTQNISSIEPETIKREKVSAQTETTIRKPRRKVFTCLLILANFFALNVGYNFLVAPEGTPVLKSLMTNTVFDVWGMKKSSLLLQKISKSYGVVNGIIYNVDNPSAIVGDVIIRQGETVCGVRVVKIYKTKIEFEKDGYSWTQKVKEPPNSCW